MDLVMLVITVGNGVGLWLAVLSVCFQRKVRISEIYVTKAELKISAFMEF